MLSHLGSVLSTLRTGWTPSSSVPRSRPWTLALALVVLVAWQFSFSVPGATDSTFRVWASTGLHANGKFVFFLRHLNLYPLATRAPIRADTREEAERILRTQPRSLVMDVGSTFRSGDRGRTLLFLVDSFLRAKTLDLSVRPATVVAWLLALCGLFVAFFRAGAPALGTCLVVALGSNIAATYEIYGAETRFGGANIFGWAFIGLVALLALHGDLLLGTGRRLRRWVWLVPVASGMLVASIRTVRSEPTPILASCVLVYLMQGWLPWPKRLLLGAALAASFFLSTSCWDRFFRFEFDRVVATLERVGGTPYPGPYVRYHELWHPIWCGLGDFDRTHGYVWDDRAAYAYAIPIMRDKYHVDIPSTDVSSGFIKGDPWDGAGLYPRLFSELPHYTEVIRDKILDDIRSDPKWYLTILGQRFRRVLFENAPVQVAWGSHRWRLPAKAGAGFCSARSSCSPAFETRPAPRSSCSPSPFGPRRFLCTRTVACHRTRRSHTPWQPLSSWDVSSRRWRVWAEAVVDLEPFADAVRQATPRGGAAGRSSSPENCGGGALRGGSKGAAAQTSKWSIS